MPVTTKAQRSTEGGYSGDSVKPRVCEFPSKIKKSAKSRDILKGLLFLPAEPKILNKVREMATRESGLLVILCRQMCQMK